MAQPKRRSGAKKNKKNVPNGVAHIQSTFNNTIVTISDTRGDTISWSSAGASGFKGAKKGTPLPHRRQPIVLVVGQWIKECAK